MHAQRDHSLDIFKGLLVVLMGYCHVLQFFGEAMLFPAVTTLETISNLVAFPGFVFAFGCAVSIAYLEKPFGAAWPRMLRAAVKPLGAFYVSGLAFRVIYERKPLAPQVVYDILLLADIPGWSEFLLAFALYGLLAMLLFRPLRALRGRPVLAVGISALCLAGCFLPYGRIHGTYAGLLIGTRDYVTFPVLQYAPYFLMGLCWPQRNSRYTWRWGAGALLCTAVGAILWWRGGGLPERFPPSIGWVLLPAAGCGLLLLISWAACKIPLGRWEGVSPLRPMMSMGRNSLYFLVATNLTIFTLAGMRITPSFQKGAGLLWGTPIQAPFGALCWSALLLAGCGFCAWLVSPGRRAVQIDRREVEKEEKT